MKKIALLLLMFVAFQVQCTGFPFLTEDRIEPCQYDK